MHATTSVSPAPTLPVRRLLPSMRALLAAFSVLTALAVVALYVLGGQTDRTFAWTIRPPLTAAFLGAGYAAGFVLVVLSLRDPVWVHTRVAVLTIFVFVALTLVATLLHRDRFHFMSEFAHLGPVARGAAWFWLAVYVVVPLLMLVLLWPQERAPGADPPPRHPVPVGLRAALAVQSVLLLAVGVPLYVVPSTAARLWPLTPLTARVVAAWLIAFGLAVGLASVAGDLRRLRTSSVAYTVFGVLELVAVLRYAGTLDWRNATTIAFVVATAAVILTGAAGWWLAPAPERTAR